MKKQLAFLLLAALTAVSATGCALYVHTPTEQLFTPGSYDVTVNGHNGNITVQTTFDQNRVTQIQVLSHEESPSIGDVAMQKTADAIIANQGFDVDIVSEATYSSYAMLEAVSTAAKAAGANVEIITRPAPEVVGDYPAPPYKPGSYTASARGFGGDVTVTIEVDEHRIVKMSAEGPSETAGIGSNAIDELPGRIAEAGNPAVDIVSGATMSSNAILEAVSGALKQAQ